MAIMEAAISSAMSHPNIVEVRVKKPTSLLQAKGFYRNILRAKRQKITLAYLALAGSFFLQTYDYILSPLSDGDTNGFRVHLVLELCDLGSLRRALNSQVFINPSIGKVNYRAVLDTAVDMARGMAHMHKHNIVHADVKARNVLLLRSAREPKGVIAKMSDFGLSLKIDDDNTHIADIVQG